MISGKSYRALSPEVQTAARESDNEATGKNRDRIAGSRHEQPVARTQAGHAEKEWSRELRQALQRRLQRSLADPAGNGGLTNFTASSKP